MGINPQVKKEQTPLTVSTTIRITVMVTVWCLIQLSKVKDLGDIVFSSFHL